MALACKIAGHRWNGCKCSRCGERRNEGHDFQFVEGACRKRCSICYDSLDVPHDWNGCMCARCGEKRDRDHSWNKAEVYSGGGSKKRLYHLRKCSTCGTIKLPPHTFTRVEGCLRRCAECGYEDVYHEFERGKCRDCGTDENEFCCKLIASGEVNYYDNETKRGQIYVKYGDHVTSVSARAKLVVALATSGRKGQDISVPVERLLKELSETAAGTSKEAQAANCALNKIALNGSIYIGWREKACAGIADSALLAEPAAVLKRWREAHKPTQADIDYENAMIAMDSGLGRSG